MKNTQFVNIPKEKFALVNENKKLHDKELVTKPIGFFKDALNRFCRNKGSIFATFIIGILVVFAIVAPIFSNYTVSYQDTYYRFTLPKVFNDIDFLDGCADKTLNERTFLYYYSMGVETGHNAIKRQEYTTTTVYGVNNEESTMYNFRQDSYQMNGVVFKNVTADEYADIQKYQDHNDVQIIYPITDKAKRPSTVQDNRDANFWFETVIADDGKISPNPDTTIINADGTVSYKNIYLPYSVGRLVSTKEFSSASKVKLISKIGSSNEFAIALPDETGTYNRFLSIKTIEDSDSVFLADSLEDAAYFTHVKTDTVNLFKITLNEHDTVSLNGDYFFGISQTGSALNLVKYTNDNLTNYNAYTVYSDSDSKVIQPQDNGDYYFGTTRTTSKNASLYFSEIDSLEKTIISSATPKNKIKITSRNSEYVLNLLRRGKAFPMKVNVNGNNHEFSTVAETMSDTATGWTFDATTKTLKTTLTGHTTASLDGEYTFALKIKNDSETSLDLVKTSEIDNDRIFALIVSETNGSTPVDSIASGNSYYIGKNATYEIRNNYFINGEFEGDNYTSKMRIEGNGNYEYAYAIATGKSFQIRINYYEYYKYYHKAILKDKITEPFFIFGTTNNGQDIFTCLASGARFSFIMAIIVATVNLVVGAIYGAIEGYYGGKIDLIMERIVEILSAVPFMIVITLLKYHMGGSSQVIILFIAFFLTGWIGMSGTVRMQFYRFKNQEYVLASRTLGASDWRIMFKHIFPNSLGTIVTSCVLVIPGMIFSETSLSYLGIINLNSGNLTSVGTLLAAGQPYLVQYPHMIVFPAVFISLLMLSFNLFGNGLRDAFNPSLRGTED